MQPTELVADTICRTVELGVTITGAAIGEDFTHIECRPVAEDPMCPSCGHCGKLRDHVTRTLTDLPVVGHPTRLQVRLSRFVCEQDSCAVSVFRQRIDRVAAPKASTTRRTARWILHCLAVKKMSVAAVAKVLEVSWDVVNSLALSTVHNLVHAQPGHLDKVRDLGVDEHKWKHVRGQGDPSFVTVIVDLTPVIDGVGPARLLDMVAGRSAAVLSTWLEARDQAFRDRVKIVSMDGFAGPHSHPERVASMDGFAGPHSHPERVAADRDRNGPVLCRCTGYADVRKETAGGMKFPAEKIGIIRRWDDPESSTSGRNQSHTYSSRPIPSSVQLRLPHPHRNTDEPGC